MYVFYCYIFYVVYLSMTLTVEGSLGPSKHGSLRPFDDLVLESPEILNCNLTTAHCPKVCTGTVNVDIFTKLKAETTSCWGKIPLLTHLMSG